MSAEPFAVQHQAIRVSHGIAVWEAMLYPWDPNDEGQHYRVSRLTMRNSDYQYAIFGDFIFRDAVHLAQYLPSPDKCLHGLRATAGVSLFRSYEQLEVAAGILPPQEYHLQIDDAGNSWMSIGEIYEARELGRGKPLLNSVAKFRDHEARAFYRERNLQSIQGPKF